DLVRDATRHGLDPRQPPTRGWGALLRPRRAGPARGLSGLDLRSNDPNSPERPFLTRLALPYWRCMQETNVSGTAAKCHHQAEALEALGKSVTRLGSALGTMGEAQESLASNLADAADKTRQHCSVSELELNRSLTTLEDVVKNIGAALS